MKKDKQAEKLSLKKFTVAKLSHAENIKGGARTGGHTKPTIKTVLTLRD